MRWFHAFCFHCSIENVAAPSKPVCFYFTYYFFLGCGNAYNERREFLLELNIEVYYKPMLISPNLYTDNKR